MSITRSHSTLGAAVATLASVALVLTGCGSSSSPSAPASSGGGDNAAAVPDIPALDKVGDGEGNVSIVAWAGYVEDGTNDKTQDWVHPFEQATGCKVNSKVAGTSDEMLQLMKTGDYDVVSASGDSSLRMVYGGVVQPVNTDLVPNYKTVFPFLKDQKWNSVNGKMYGVPHGWGANLLMSNDAVVKQAPDSWGVVFDPNSPYKGKITGYDSPIYIADAALYLSKTKPELGIKNPYALDQKQFDAAVDLLKGQRPLIGEYWSDYTKEVQAFESGDLVLGTTWQVIANLITTDAKVKVTATVPKEGSTGWSDTWMVAAKAKHPNCAYKWLDWVISPKVNAQIAQWFGEAPAQSLSCSQDGMAEHCKTFHADDEAYTKTISFWTTPTKQCLDGRTDTTCVDYAAWTQAWSSIKG